MENSWNFTYPYSCCACVSFLLMGIQIFVLMEQNKDDSLITANIAAGELQLKTEWESDFITDLYVIDKTQNCKANETSLFTYEWKGLRAYYKSKGGDFTISQTKEAQNDLVGSGFPALQATIFDNKKICVIKEGNYANTWPTQSSGQCLSGQKSCPGITGTNRICISDSKKCPVTDIHFLHRLQGNINGYQYTKFNSEFRIGISRTLNALPITMIKMEENTPCNFHWIQSIANSSKQDRFYLNDYYGKAGKIKESQNACQTNFIGRRGGTFFSGRFKKMVSNRKSLNINVGQVELQNDIKEIKKEYAANYPNENIEQELSKTMLHPWKANALRYDENCYQQGQTIVTTPKQAIQMVTNVKENLLMQEKNNSNSVLEIIRIVFYIVMVIAIWQLILMRGKKQGIIFPVTFFILSFVHWVYLGIQFSSKVKTQEIIDKLKFFAKDCLDKYEIFPNFIDTYDVSIIQVATLLEFAIQIIIIGQFCLAFLAFKKDWFEIQKSTAEEIEVQDVKNKEMMDSRQMPYQQEDGETNRNVLDK